MSDFSIEAFVEFVNSQDPKRPINHASWEECVLGDFLKNRMGLGADHLFEEFPKEIQEIKAGVLEAAPVLYQFLNHAVADNCPTYSFVQDKIKETTCVDTQ